MKFSWPHLAPPVHRIIDGEKDVRWSREKRHAAPDMYKINFAKKSRVSFEYVDSFETLQVHPFSIRSSALCGPYGGNLNCGSSM